MRKINYPHDMSALNKEYEKLFDIGKMQEQWDLLKNKLRKVSPDVSLYPDNVQEYLTMPYTRLVDVFCDYHSRNFKNDENLHTELQKLFYYSKSSDIKGAYISAMQPEIAKFFMKHADELGLHVCHYCETSYINVYGMGGVGSDIADFLLNAPEDKIRSYVRCADGKELSERTIKSIMKLRDKDNVNISNILDEFDNMGIWKGVKKSEELKPRLMNHFDLDHFLPKSECPIVGLSLYNFVPSCSVCNEKLKRDQIIGGIDKDRLIKLSPTSDSYNFDGNQYLTIIPNSGSLLFNTRYNPDDYRMEFQSEDADYHHVVDTFRLEERYNYHKSLALRLYDRYIDYPPAVIEMFEEVFEKKKSKKDIEEDIFGDDFSKTHNRCFDKLRRDMKKLSRR